MSFTESEVKELVPLGAFYALCSAAAEGNAARVKDLAHKGADVNKSDYDKRTPLHIAASEGNLEIVKFLVEEGKVDVNPEDRFGGTPLSDALREHHKDVVKYLRSKGAISEQTESQVAALLTAVGSGDVAKVRTMLEGGVDPNAKDYDRRSAAHIAASEGKLEVLELLQSKGADINAEDRWGRTPMNDARHHNHQHIIKFLQSKGGKANVKPEDLVLELCKNSANGDLSQVKHLIESGADSNCKDYDGRTPLHVAASEGHLSVVKYLVERGASVHAADRWGATPLNDAIRTKHTGVADFLKEKGAKLFIDKEREAVTLCTAVGQGDLGLVKHLVENGAGVNSKDYDSRSALHIASAEGEIDIVKFLVSSGADVNLKDRWGNTPARDAKRHGYTAVHKFLLENGATAVEKKKKKKKKQPKEEVKEVDASLMPKDTKDELESLDIILFVKKIQSGIPFPTFSVNCLEVLVQRFDKTNDPKHKEKKKFGNDGAAIVLDVMKHHKDNEDIQRLGGLVVNLLSCVDKLNTKMAEEGAVLVMFNVLRSRGFDMRTKVLAMTALSNLTHSNNLKADKIARAFAREGGVRAMVQLLNSRDHQDKDFLFQSLVTLWNVCNIDEKNARRFELENGLGSVVSLWRKHSDDTKFVHTATGAVSAVLVQPDLQLVFREELNGLELVLDTMKSHLDDVKIQENLCCILVLLAATSDESFSRPPKAELADELCQASGLHVLIDSMQRHAEIVTLQENAAAVLFYLGQKSQRIRKPMLEAGALTAVEAAIKQHPNSFALKELKKKLKIYKKGCVLM